MLPRLSPSSDSGRTKCKLMRVVRLVELGAAFTVMSYAAQICFAALPALQADELPHWGVLRLNPFNWTD
ncbi:MAG: hypothetical protein KGQ48_08960, partial [Bradyrhizobium sp.]|nr:hypothetical protein [Bradyrhizobium sp.]